MLIDHLTEWANAYLIINKRGSTIAYILYREYFSWHSLPEVLISDNDTDFVNSAISDLCETWGLNVRQAQFTTHKVMVKWRGSTGHSKG